MFQGPAPLRCKQQAVAIMCLGADVELTIVPTSGYPFAPHNERSAGNGRAARRRSRDEGGWSNSDSNSDSEDDEPLAASMLKKRKSKKAARESMLFTLVHGDVVVLCGDDFEVSEIRGRVPRPPLRSDAVHDSPYGDEHRSGFSTLF